MGKKENKMPKAVIIVDLYGQSADYDELLPICERYGVPVIEDAAEALGATYKGKKCGTFGHIGIFSFNGNKIITTSGGGMVVSNDAEAIKKMRFWATQSREAAKHYEHKEVGYNYRISNISAGIGRGQLQALDGFIDNRKFIFDQYVDGFNELPLRFMPISDLGSPNYWLSVLTINEGVDVTPEYIVNQLEMKNIESRPLWKPMHLQPLFIDTPIFNHYETKSVGSYLFQYGICLPSGSSMTQDQQRLVINTFSEVFESDKR